MKKILILYFSGAGATLNSIKYMQTCINNITGCSAYIHSMENDLEENINNYDALIIGTPCYHCAPCLTLISFFQKLPKLINTKPTMVFNSYSLWSCNTNRITAKIIREKNIITIYDTAYRSPASDGTLITPFIKRFFEFEKNIYEKINADCNKFVSIINEEYTFSLPHFHRRTFLPIRRYFTHSEISTRHHTHIMSELRGEHKHPADSRFRHFPFQCRTHFHRVPSATWTQLAQGHGGSTPANPLLVSLRCIH